jgi:hypothetical protein
MTGSFEACIGHCSRGSSRRHPAAETPASGLTQRAICGRTGHYRATQREKNVAWTCLAIGHYYGWEIVTLRFKPKWGGVSCQPFRVQG